jgi:hypothetical protein
MFEILAMHSKTKLLFAVFPLTLVLLAGCAGEPRHPTWNTSTGAEQHERLMWQAMKGQQWKDVESHLAPTFVGVDADGKKYDRAGWLVYWKSASFGDYSLGEVTVDPAGTDMVVSYKLVLNSKTSGESSSGNSGGANNIGSNQSLRVVSVWQQVKKGWILTATSLTPIRE